MLILAVDSASDSLKIGLADQNRIRGSFDGPPDRSHSEKIISALDNLLRVSHIDPQQIDALAIATGPGSFTGLRIGIATLLGLAEAWVKPIVGSANSNIAQSFFQSLDQNPVVLFHCRADQFYVSDGLKPVFIDTWDSLKSTYLDRTFAGNGVEKLLRAGGAIGPRKICNPANYSAGELAQLFARNYESFEQLDPVNLDVNYFLKSQPEQIREQNATALVINDMMPSDLAAIEKIEVETFSDPWTQDNFRSDLKDSNTINLVARQDENCIGYLVCIAIDEYGYIANIAVDQAARSLGIGTKMLKELEKRLEKKDIRQIVLDVRISNIRAIKFYKEHGFTILTRRVGFYSDPPEDSYTMLKASESSL